MKTLDEILDLAGQGIEHSECDDSCGEGAFYDQAKAQLNTYITELFEECLPEKKNNLSELARLGGRMLGEDYQNKGFDLAIDQAKTNLKNKLEGK